MPTWNEIDRARDLAAQAIRNGEAFRYGRTALTGTPGPATTLGDLPDVGEWHLLARSATYVIWSYETPIAWLAGRWMVPDVSFSVTTTNHQGTTAAILCRLTTWQGWTQASDPLPPGWHRMRDTHRIARDSVFRYGYRGNG